MARSDDEARDLLARPPVPPADPSRLSADSDVCGPGLYPQGPPMVPAQGPGPDDAEVRRLLEASVAARSAAAPALGRFDDPAIVALAPDAGIRASLCLLSGTVAEPVLDAALADPEVLSIRWGTPSGGGRIAGPSESHSGHRVVSERYRHEHPALLSGALAHEVLHTDPPRSDHEETWLHAVLAFVHLQLLAAEPALADLRTELSRRMASFAISLGCSRRPGDPTFRLVAPEGTGTIPGGAPSMQTPDFWSIPFLSDHPDPAPMPAAMLEVLARLTDGAPIPAGAAYDEATARWLDAHLGRGWLSWPERVGALQALGVVPT